MGDDHIMDADEERYRDDLVIPGRDDVPECDTPISRDNSFIRGGDDRRYIEVPKVRNAKRFGGGEPDRGNAYLFVGGLLLVFVFLFLYEFIRRSRVALELRLGKYKKLYKADLEAEKKEKEK